TRNLARRARTASRRIVGCHHRRGPGSNSPEPRQRPDITVQFESVSWWRETPPEEEDEHCGDDASAESRWENRPRRGRAVRLERASAAPSGRRIRTGRFRTTTPLPTVLS